MTHVSLVLSCLLVSLASITASASTPEQLDAITPVRSCESLTAIDLTGIAGTGSKLTQAISTNQEGKKQCVVEGHLSPSITFNLILPEQGWTQRYLQVGCGGLCGRIGLQVGAADGCAPLNAGEFAMAGTDMGHQDQDGSFGHDQQKRADFAHRAVHLTALASVAVIKAFYGRAPAYRYFTGCSDGGREALVEAQRYPEDFDGIIAGAAALNFQVQNGFYHAWQARANTGEDGKAILVASRLPLLHQAVLKQCDGLDGLEDGLLSDPRACHFDPQELQCKDGQQAETCLSADEVKAAKQLYDGPRDPNTNERLTAGGPQPGSELGWAGVFVPHDRDQPIFSKMIALQALRNLIFDPAPGPDFSLDDLRFEAKTFDLLRARHPLFDATNPDVSAFAATGGKLIIWHGWSDPHISPINSIAYYEAMKAQLGETRTNDFSRLYLLPGVYHCSGGEGPAELDLLTPMMAWVEQGAVPDAIVTRQAPPRDRPNGFGAPLGTPDAAGKPHFGASGERPPMMPMGGPQDTPGSNLNIGRTRPVYPYPLVAAYNGQGDPQKAENYRSSAPLVVTQPVQWRGTDFFEPYVSPRH
ncbi:tannase/feruloyl esterase family alpha/beta hydrolase [Pseudomonas sp. NY15364]|uniref:tannase/feruloyl esterase family alpha/beta hydrolase n=1 Tax=Pseudomonas sp. NY15364 TaxID=3400353 RepID=UPI003A89A4C4